MKKFNGIKLVLIICFFSITQIMFSQENNSKQTDKSVNQTVKKNTSERSSEVKTKAVTSPASNSSNNDVQKRVDTQGKSFQLDENDAYQGRTEEFLSQITLKQLPSDFPKYEKWMGVRHYNEIISDYYKQHLDIVTPIVKQKLTQTH